MSSLSFDTISPTVSQAQNVLFGAESKDSYEKLRAPISRTALRPPLAIDLRNLSSCLHRPVLHQRIWTRDPSYSDSRIHLGARFPSSPSVFLWVSVDQVRLPPPFLAALGSAKVAWGIASFPASRCAEWPQQSHVLGRCARKFFSVSSCRRATGSVSRSQRSLTQRPNTMSQ